MRFTPMQTMLYRGPTPSLGKDLASIVHGTLFVVVLSYQERREKDEKEQYRIPSHLGLGNSNTRETISIT